jgi:hypothetical protein
VNTAYATTLAATGGTAPYTWTVSSGTLVRWCTARATTVRRTAARLLD